MDRQISLTIYISLSLEAWASLSSPPLSLPKDTLSSTQAPPDVPQEHLFPLHQVWRRGGPGEYHIEDPRPPTIPQTLLLITADKVAGAAPYSSWPPAAWLQARPEALNCGERKSCGKKM